MGKGRGTLALLRADRLAAYEGRDVPGGAVRAFADFVLRPPLRACALVRLTLAAPRWLTWLPRNLLVTLHRMDVVLPLSVGPGLRLPEPHGIALGRARFGADVTLEAEVTIGGEQIDSGRHTLLVGDGARIGCGATVVLNGEIGAGATIPPGRYVSRSVPAGTES